MSFNIYPPSNRLPLWTVPTCDLELRVVAPGRVNMQRNQEPRRGRICILEPPQRGHVKFPQWECVHRSSFPVLSLGSHFQGDHFLPHCPITSDSEMRPGQPMGRGRAEGVPKARQGSKGVPQHPWSSSCPLPWPEPPPAPRPWGITTDTFRPALALPPAQPLCKSQRTLN